MPKSSNRNQNEDNSFSVTSTKIGGASATIMGDDRNSVNINIAGPLASKMGVKEVGEYDLFGVGIRALGVGFDFGFSLDPQTNSISLSLGAGVVGNLEGKLTLDLDDFSLSGSWNGFLSMETGAGIGVLGFGLGAGLGARYDEGTLRIGGHLDAFHLGLNVESTLMDLNQKETDGYFSYGPRNTLAERARLEKAGELGDTGDGPEGKVYDINRDKQYDRNALSAAQREK